MWYCYLLVSDSNKNTYVGVTTNIFRRLRQHNGYLKGGAKRTRSNRPWYLFAYAHLNDRCSALRCEYKLKKVNGFEKRLKLLREICAKNSVTLNE